MVDHCRRRLIAATAVPAAVTLGACAAPAGRNVGKPGARRSVTLLHVNDSHGRHQAIEVAPGSATAQTGDPGREPESFDRSGRVGGYAALATALADARRRHGAGRVLLLHAGWAGCTATTQSAVGVISRPWKKRWSGLSSSRCAAQEPWRRRR